MNETAGNSVSRLRGWLGYVITIVAEAILTALLVVIRPVFPLADLPLPYVLLTLAIGYWLGLGQAIFASVIGLFAYIFFFLLPEHTFLSSQGSTRLVAYITGSAIVIISALQVHGRRRRYEQLADDLRRSGERTARILESIGDAFVSLDRDWRFTYVNSQAEQMMHRSRSQLIGKVLWDVFPADVIEPFREKSVEAMSAQTPMVIVDFWPITGRWVEMHAYPTDEGLSVFANDITKRKNAEEALQESKERFRNLVESTSDWVWETDQNGHYTYASPKIRDLLGFEPEEVIGKSFMDLMPRQEAERIASITEDIFLHREPIRLLDNTLVHKDGHLVTVQTSGTPAYDGKGEFCGYRGIDRDITTRKQFEEALRESEFKYRQLFNGANDSIFLLEMSEGAPNRFSDVNEAACQRLGYTREELLTKSPLDIDSPETRGRIASTAKDLAEKGHITIETVHITSTGKRFPVEINMRSFDLMGKKMVLAIARDITDRKAAEEALRKSEYRYRTLIETMNEGFVEADRDYRFAYVNPRMVEMLGYSPDEIIGRYLTDFLDEPNREILRSQMAERKKGKQKPYELTWIGRTGEKVIAMISPRPVFDENGQFAGSFGVITDITELKETEAALRRSEQHYRAVVQDQTELICRWQPDGSLTFVNEAFCRYYGKTCDELVGHNLIEFIAEEDRESVQKLFESLTVENPVAIIEHRTEAADGSKHWLQWVNRALFDERGNLVEYQSVGRDLTESKRIEMELAETRIELERRAAELQATVSSLADGVALFDTDYNPLFINEAGKGILEVPEGESLEKWLIRLERFDLEGRPIPTEESPACRALDGEIVKDMRYVLVTPWKKRLVLSASASPVRDTAGNITGATLVFRDQRERVELERERQELLNREHRIAEILQESLLPSQQAYDISGYEIAVRYQPGLKEATIGGDFYDVFDVGDDKIGVVIGDVAGKGLLAAMHVASARYAIRSYAYLDSSPAVCLTLANNALSKGNEDGSGFLTAVFGVIDSKEGTLTYANAGHESPILIDTEGNMKDLEPTGIALGIQEDLTYGERSIKLHPGEKVVMFTDGITEARHDANIFFEEEGVIKYLTEALGLPPDEIASGLLTAAKEHAGGELQDDAAIVVFGIRSRD